MLATSLLGWQVGLFFSIARTGTQSLRMNEVLRYLWRSPSPVLSSKHDQLGQAAPDHICAVLNTNRDGKSTTFSGNLFSTQTTSQYKNVSWYSEWTSPVSVHAHCIWSCHWIPQKWVWLPHQIFIHTDKVPPEPPLLQAKQSQPFHPNPLSSLGKKEDLRNYRPVQAV